MIISLNNQTHSSKSDVLNLIKTMDSSVDIHEIPDGSLVNIGLVGDLRKIDVEKIKSQKHVEKVVEIEEPYKRTNRKFKTKNTIVDIEGKTIGGEALGIIAGPCSVENREQLLTIAKEIAPAGANFLRGGAYKPRTSPYSFQGLGEEGLNLLQEAKKITGMPIVTELMKADLVELFLEKADVFQIGARNMQNFDLLKEVGRTNKPVLLKRGMSSTIKEFLMAAEYIMSQGNDNVILCERGIRTFEDFTRNTLDLSSIIAIKELSHLPIIVDPSHATGKWWMIDKLSKAAIIAGADGLMIEVHHDPKNALSDGPQSLLPKRFNKLMRELKVIAEVANRKLQG